MDTNERTGKQFPIFTNHMQTVYEAKDTILKSRVCMNTHPHPHQGWSLFSSDCSNEKLEVLITEIENSSIGNLDYFFHFDARSSVIINATGGNTYYRMTSNSKTAAKFDKDYCNGTDPTKKGFNDISATPKTVFENVGYYHYLLQQYARESYL